MTEFDPALVYRAEQAILGALLAGHDPSAMMASLHTEHFTDPVHQALYLAVTGQGDGGTAGRLRSRLGRVTSARVRRTAAYAVELRGLCPDPGHRWVYAAMLLEAHEARHPAPEAGPRQAGADQRLASAGDWLASAGASGRRGRGAGQNGTVDRRTRQLAATLRPAVQALARAGREDRVARVKAAGGGPVLDWERALGERQLCREDLQDAVLADLMRRPGEGAGMVRRVPAEAFSPGPRRELYAFLRKAISAGIPVDPLIAAWQAAKHEPGQPQPEGGESLAVLTARLAKMATTRGTAAVLGRVLLADHECTQAFGPRWTTRPLPWNTAKPAPGSQPPSPAPGATPGAARSAPVSRPGQQAAAVPPIVPRPRQDGGTGPLPRQQ